MPKPTAAANATPLPAAKPISIKDLDLGLMDIDDHLGTVGDLAQLILMAAVDLDQHEQDAIQAGTRLMMDQLSICRTALAEIRTHRKEAANA